MSTNRLLILTVLATAIFAGPAVYAAEQKKEVPPVNFAEEGTWVGVIEDIQDIDDSRLAEFQTKYGIPTVGKAIDMAINSYIALATGHVVLPIGGIVESYTSRRSQLRDDPRIFQITFKQGNGTLSSVVVRDQQQWEVGDKIKVTSDGTKIVVETIEMGELSKYAAEQRALRRE